MFSLSSKTLRKGTSGATLGIPWSSWLDSNPGLFYFQSLHRHRVAVYTLKYIKPYLGTNKQACWKASSIGFVFYISKWLVDVVLVDTSKVFVFSERKAVCGDILCALCYAAENCVFLLGGSDASLVPWQIGRLAQYFISAWLASVLGGFTSSPLTLKLWLTFFVFHPIPRCARHPGVNAPALRRCQKWRRFPLSQGEAYVRSPTANG